MAASSLLLSFNGVLSRFSSGGKLPCASTRRYCQPMRTRCSLEEFESRSHDLFRYISLNVVAIESAFSAPGESTSRRLGTGVYLDPLLILTSASLVGRVVAEKKDGGVLYRSDFAEPTLAVTRDQCTLLLTPWAVNFGSDVAVLRVVDKLNSRPLPEKIMLPRYSMAYPGLTTNKNDLVMAIVHVGGEQFAILPGSIRSTDGEKSFNVKAPWPLNNDLGCLEFDMSKFNGGNPPPSCSLFSSKDVITGSFMERFSGSPLFNIHGDIIGVLSWEVREYADSPFPVFFAASSLSIRNVIKYSRNKSSYDSIVMDTWIESSYRFRKWW